MSIARKDTCYICNSDGITKRVKKEKLDAYLEKGWNMGVNWPSNCGTKGKVWVTNGTTTKYCTHEELNSLLESGWRKGRTMKTFLKSKKGGDLFL